MVPISSAETEMHGTRSCLRAEREKGDVPRRRRGEKGQASAPEGKDKQAKSSNETKSLETKQMKQGSKVAEPTKQENGKAVAGKVGCDRSCRKKDANTMQILVKQAGNEKAITVVIDRNAKVRDLKQAIAKQPHAQAGNSTEFRIIYGGKILEDDLHLSEYAISNLCTIHLILPSGCDDADVKVGALQRSASQQSMSTRAESCVKRSSSMQSLDHFEAEDETAISCEALRYVDMKWYRAFRGAKTSKGFFVIFPQFRTEGGQETSSEHIKLRPYWWRSLREEDVISLEPLNRLKYEPFELPSSKEKTHWFDGKVLANYLISSANFVHPVSRRPLERSEMLRLDDYISKHSLGKAMVVHVFDRKDDSSENATNHVTALRREATELLGALFASRNSGAALRGRASDGRDQRDRRQGPQTQPGMRVAAQGSQSRRGNGRAEVRNRSSKTHLEHESLMMTISKLRTAAESTMEETEVAERNQALVRKMKICLSDAEQRKSASGVSGVGGDPIEISIVRFDELRSISGDFRSGALGGEEYALQLLEIFGYEFASSRERNAVDDVLVELLALLPDLNRRKELAAALVNCLERLALDERHILQVADPSVGARRAIENASSQGPSAALPGVDEGGTRPVETAEAILESQAFPSLDGSERLSVGAVFGGAWLSRPRRGDLEQATARGDVGGRSDGAEEAFPVLREVGRDVAAQGPIGVWGGDGGGRTQAGSEPREAAPATRKTKRGTLLLF